MKHLYCCLLLFCLLLLALPSQAGKRKHLRPAHLASRTEAGELVGAVSVPVVEIRTINKVANYQLKRVRKFEQFGTWEEAAPDALVYEEGIQADELTQPIKDAIARAQSLTNFVRENQRYIDLLGPQSIFELPAAINSSIAGLDYTIVFDEARMMAGWAEIDVYMVFTVPQNDQTLTFMGRGIKFSKEGGLIGDLRLELLGDHAIGLNAQKSLMTLKGVNDLALIQSENIQSGNYVVFDCNGFVEMGLNADVTFSRDLILPEVNGEIVEDTESRVTGHFTTVLSDWNDLVVEIDLPRFQVKGLKGVGFDVEGAVFDFSDVRNAPGIVFPDSYASPQFSGESRNAWRGVYIQNVEVFLPKQFAKRNSSNRVSFSGQNLIFDERGFSGTLSAKNIIPMEEGVMDKWSFSVEDLLVQLDAGTLVGAGFGGSVMTSIADRPFEYAAVIREGNQYIFTISPPDEFGFPVWKAADVELYEGSYLEVGILQGKFMPRACLNGKLSIVNPAENMALPEINFEALTIQTTKPYVTARSFSLGASSKEHKQQIANFPVQLKNVQLVQGNTEEEVGIAFDLLINLMNSKKEGAGDKGFAAQAGAAVIGTLDEEAPLHEFKYDRLRIDRAALDINMGKFEFHGYVEFFRNHAVYGKGFFGTLEAIFPMGLRVDATALFGATPEYRYWYVDAMAARSNAGISTPGIGISGLGGGAFHHMRQAGFDLSPNNAIGKTRSGLVYAPDNTISLGFKAMVAFETRPTRAAFNGTATLEIAFSSSGGIDNICLSGVGNFMKAPGMDPLAQLQDKVGTVLDKAADVADKFSAAVNQASIDNARELIGADPGENPMVAALKILYDVNNATLHGNLQVYVNVGRALTGVGANGLAGEAVVHFAPNEWYIHVGTPENRVGLQFLKIARTGSYFMIGDNLPGSPAPDENVGNILPGDVDLDYMRDENALGTGSGFAFGSAFSLDTGPLRFLVFYARFMAGAGFDIMLKDYGDNVRCEGREGPLGINGWYANGQAYAYFDGDIGIEVNLAFIKGKYRILQIGAAAVLQAKLPNPFWMQGVVGGYFSILNGLISGNCQFRVTIGEECDIVGEGSVVEGIEVIAELTPKDAEKELSVFTKPQAVFNMPVNKVFRLEDLDGTVKSYRIKLDHFKVLKDGRSLPANLEWNEAHDVVAFNAVDLLPGTSKLTVEVQVSFQYSQDGWNPVLVNGKPVTESKTITFTTGLMPDHIPERNVQYSYPVARMYNFYPGEYGEGYLKLISGQDALFQKTEGWEQVVRFSTGTGTTVEVPLSYSQPDNTVSFDIPQGFQPNTIYQWSIVSKPLEQGPAIDANVDSVNTTIITGEDGLEISLKTQEAKGNLEVLEEKVLYSNYFRTSIYTTFSAKLDQIKPVSRYYWGLYGGIGRLGINLEGTEFFDRYETQGVDGQGPGIEMTALVGNSWLDDEVNPLIYDRRNGAIRWRDTKILGIPPYKAVYLRNQEDSKVLTDGEILSNTPLGINTSFGEMHYDLCEVVHEDYSELRDRAAGIPPDQRSSWQDMIARSQFPGLKPGKYMVTLRYVLPGTGKVTSQRDYLFRYD